MRKNVGIMIVAIVLLIFGGGYYFMNRKVEDSNLSSTKVQSNDERVLILYYSNSGTTEEAAKTIQKKTGAELIEMKISPDYPTNYSQLTDVTKKQIDTNARPEITNLPDLSKYDTILLGFPTWYHRPPMFINTFFETADLNGKVVIPFTTSMTSSFSENEPYLTKMSKGTNVKLQEGFRANENSTITKYLTKYGLIK